MAWTFFLYYVSLVLSNNNFHKIKFNAISPKGIKETNGNRIYKNKKITYASKEDIRREGKPDISLNWQLQERNPHTGKRKS